MESIRSERGGGERVLCALCSARIHNPTPTPVPTSNPHPTPHTPHPTPHTPPHTPTHLHSEVGLMDPTGQKLPRRGSPKSLSLWITELPPMGTVA